MAFRRIRHKKVDKKIDEIYSLFQTKRFFSSWRHVVKRNAKIHTIGEKKYPHSFCVKYSEFCKCVKCERIRSKFEAIGPQNQKLAKTFLAVDPAPIKKEKCLPFSQLYEPEQKNNLTLATAASQKSGLTTFSQIPPNNSLKNPLNQPLMRPNSSRRDFTKNSFM